MSVWLFCLYWLTSILYGLSFAFSLDFVKKISNVLLTVLLGFHAFLLFSFFLEGSSKIEISYFFTNIGVLSTVSFFILFTYFLLELFSKNIAPSIFLLPLASFIQTSSFLIAKQKQIHSFVTYSIFEKFLLWVHVLSAVVAYTLFIVSTIFALLYVLLFKSIKEKRFSFLFQKLPSLQRTNYIAYIFSGVAYITLGLSVAVGFVWNAFQLEKVIADIRIWLVCWVLFWYTLVLILYLLNKISSLLFSISLLVLFWFVLSSLLLNLFYPSFHSF